MERYRVTIVLRSTVLLVSEPMDKREAQIAYNNLHGRLTYDAGFEISVAKVTTVHSDVTREFMTGAKGLG